MKVDRTNLTVQNTVVKKKYHNRGFDKRWVCSDPDSYTLSTKEILMSLVLRDRKINFADRFDPTISIVNQCP